MQKVNWDDLRFVLAVAENGSLAAAARELGVNHATVLRRIAAFEERHGGAIFQRTARGYWLPPERAPLVDAARSVEAAVLAVYRQIEGGQEPLNGVVRLTSTDTLCASVLPPILTEIGRRAPGLRLELLCSNTHLDLARLESEITVRPAPSLPEALVGTHAADLGFGVYSAPQGDPRWLALGPALSRSMPAEWMLRNVPETEIAGTADSFVSLREMAATGMGRAFLPAVLGEADPRLRRHDGIAPPMAVPLWVATHADLAKAPRVAVVCDLLAQALAARAEALRGPE